MKRNNTRNPRIRKSHIGDIKFMPGTTVGPKYINLSTLSFESLPWESFTKNDIAALRIFANQY